MRKRIAVLMVFVLVLMNGSVDQVMAESRDNNAKLSVYDDIDDDYDDTDEDYNDDIDEDYDDIDDEYDDIDEDYDDEEDNDNIIALYKKIVKRYKKVKLTSGKPLIGSYSGLNEGGTLVYPFTVAKKTKVILRFTDKTYGELAFKICNSQNKTILEKTAKYSFNTKGYPITLNAGTYSLKICSKDYDSDVHFRLFITTISINKTLRGLQTYKAAPGFGNGTWKTSNKKVVKISKTSGSATTLTPVKPGKATISFKNDNCTATYKITVKKLKKTINITRSSCDFFEANPKLGKGTWKVGNKNIAMVSSKYAAKTKITAKNKGKTTITFDTPLATYYYKLTVIVGKAYPIDRGYFTTDLADGVEPSILISNNSNKTIKYVDFRVYFYNAVNDPAYWMGTSYRDLRAIGPLKPWKFHWYDWDPVFYSNVVYKMRIKTATVTYMDGTKKTINVNKSFYYDDSDE